MDSSLGRQLQQTGHTNYKQDLITTLERVTCMDQMNDVRCAIQTLCTKVTNMSTNRRVCTNTEFENITCHLIQGVNNNI